MPAKRKGSEVRENVSIRLEPSQKDEIKKVFGSVQLWIDHCIEILNDTKGVSNEIKKSNPNEPTR